MTEQIETRTTYDTWEDAFRGLAPVVRQQSVRVATYTRTLYIQACAVGFAGGDDRMQASFADLAYKCGMYHQLGKALVVPEYQVENKSFSAEETALYRKYTTEGRRLVASLQDKKNRGADTEIPTSNIPWLMIRESCSEHAERFDGGGFPNALQGNKISPIAQIVGMARMFDILSSGIKSETPFADACDEITAQNGRAFSPELCEIFVAARAKLQADFNKFIHYTKKLPRTIPLVKKTKNRPLGLEYRYLCGGDLNVITAYEASPWFLLDGERKETVSEVVPRLVRTGIITDTCFYLLYEAADALLRIQNCKIDVKYLLLQMPTEFYTKENHMKRFDELFDRQPIDRSRLLITVSEKTVLEANKGELEVICRYLKNGIELVLDDYHPDTLLPSKLKELGFNFVRLSADLCKKPEYASDIRALLDKNITVFASCTDGAERDWLAKSGVYAISGDSFSQPVDEQTLIRDTLNYEREELI